MVDPNLIQQFLLQQALSQQQSGQPQQPAQQMSQQGQFNPADMQAGLQGGPQPFSFASVPGGIGRNIINALAQAGKAATYVAEDPRERQADDARAQQLYETKQRMALAAGEFGQREKDRAQQAATAKEEFAQREKDRGSQAQLFAQQDKLASQRETARQQAERDAETARQASQSRLFSEQEKQQGSRFSEEEKLQGIRDKAADLRAQRAADRADTSKREKAITYWQPTLDSAERVNVMSKNYEEGVNNHNQQAMLSLLSNHLGMTMGLQKGARLNQALITEAQKSQPWLQGMAAKFDKDGYLSGVTLSPNQMKQMLDLGFDRYREDVKKSRSTSGFIGVKDEPPRQISKEAAQYYRDAAGGDVNKAKAMAQQDGWTF